MLRVVVLVLVSVVTASCMRDEEPLNNVVRQDSDAAVIGGCRFVGPINDIFFSNVKTLARDCTMIWAEKNNHTNKILISGSMDLKYIKHGVYELIGFFADIKTSSMHRNNSKGTKYTKLPNAAPLLQDIVIEEGGVVYIGNLKVDVTKSMIVPLAIEIELNEKDAGQVAEKVVGLNKGMQVEPMCFSEETKFMKDSFGKK